MGGFWADIWQLLADVWDYVQNNPSVAAVILTFLLALKKDVRAGLWWAVSWIGGWMQRWRVQPGLVARSLPLDGSPFERIPYRSDGVVRRLLGSQDADDPLAEHNIPYQTRVKGRDIPQEIIDCLERPEDGERRWVLLLGRSGLGKSREAAQATSRLNGDGWTVLKLKPLGWETLFRPDAKLFEEMGDRQLLFFLDDVNRMIPLERGRVGARPPEGEKALAETHPLDGLLEFLAQVETYCRSENVRVIATARNETVSEKLGEPSELEKLGLDKFELWQRFQLFELPDPEVEALVDLQRDGVNAAELEADASRYEPLAVNSDRTMRVFVNNLREARRENRPLEDVSEKNLEASWKRLYNQTKAQYTATTDIYAAVMLLRSLQVALVPEIVLPTAQMLVSRRKSPWESWLRRWPLRRALSYLTHQDSTNILSPKDGQLEASGIRIETGDYAPMVLDLLLRLSKWESVAAIAFSLRGIGEVMYEQGRYPLAVRSFKGAIALVQPLVNLEKMRSTASQQPTPIQSFLHLVWFSVGNCYSVLREKEKAIASYDRALVIQPDFHVAWYNRGNALAAQGDYREAIVSYDRALEIQPDFHQAWTNRGTALATRGDYGEAIASYDRALEIQPDFHEAWNNRGIALAAQGDYRGAIASYDRALEIQPDDHEAWNNRGTALATREDYGEAIASYDRALDIKPDYPKAWNNRGIALAAQGDYRGAIASYDRALEIQPDKHQALYNKACSYALWGKGDEAIEMLERAIELAPEWREWAKTDGDFEGMRGNERFRRLVEG